MTSDEKLQVAVRGMMTDAERAALAKMVYEAIRFADLMAGEGICLSDDADARDPAIFLSEYVEAIGGDSWEGLAEAARDAIMDKPGHPLRRHEQKKGE